MDNTRISRLVLVVGLALSALGLSAGRARAQNFDGNFRLPFEARWGLATLPPGDYSFRMETAASPYTAYVFTKEGRCVALIMARTVAEVGPSDRSQLTVVPHGRTGTIVALHLPEVGRGFTYSLPKGERLIAAGTPELIQRLPIVRNGK